MVAIRLSPFGGMVPAVDIRLLAPTNASFSQNSWLFDGSLMGFPTPKPLYTLFNSSNTKVYRLPNNYTDSAHLSDSRWMEFPHPDTDVIRSQVFGDTFDRYYWASPAGPPRYNTHAGVVASTPLMAGAYLLGVPAPTAALSGAPAGGVSATLKTVAYVQTFVSAYGEEGPPNAPLILTGVKIDATVNLNLVAADPGDLGTNRNLTRKRIYRTITAANGDTTYFFVADVPIAQAAYADSALDDVIAFNAQLSSTTWTGPPSDLQGWVVMGNGIVAGFRNNEVWFCEPFRMHAWPAQYAVVVEYPIVGIGVQNQQLVVCTEGYTYTVSGIHPSTMAINRIAGLAPCTSRGSIVSATEGVYFSTPSGLAFVNASGLTIITKDIIRKEHWNSQPAINTLRAVILQGAYYGWGRVVEGVFQADAFQADMVQAQDFSGALAGVFVDPTNQITAHNSLRTAVNTVNVQSDAWSGEVFIIRNSVVYWLDISDPTDIREPYYWRSKLFQTPEQKNFTAAKIFFEPFINMPAQNPVRNTTQPQNTLAADQWGMWRLYAYDNKQNTYTLVQCFEIRTSGEQFRLPSGYKADFWMIEIEARVKVTSIQMATSPTELKSV